MLIKGGPLQKDIIRNILLIQFGDIGDVVYSFPCVLALKETFPTARVVMAVQKKAEGLVSDCPGADDVIVVDKQERSLFQVLVHHKKFWCRVRGFKFDLAIDLRTGSRGAILALLSGSKQRVGRYNPDGNWWRSKLFSHIVHPKGGMDQYIAEYYLDTLIEYGIVTSDIDPRITPSHEKQTTIKGILQENGVPPDIPMFAIQPFSLWQYKEWAIDNYIALINDITKKFKVSVFITGSKDEQERAQIITDACGAEVFNLAGKTSLNLLPALLRSASIFLGVDSAGVHIAAAVGTPTISLYGPSSADTWAPKGKGHVVITKDMTCVPCKETGCQGSLKSRCMEELSVEDVVGIVSAQLQEVCGSGE